MKQINILYSIFHKYNIFYNFNKQFKKFFVAGTTSSEWEKYIKTSRSILRIIIVNKH